MDEKKKYEYKKHLIRLNAFEWILPKTVREGMNVDGKIIANDAILDAIEEDAIHQLTNVAMLPGIIGPVLAMPDAHFGYGLPMGSVAAFDAEDGIISSGLCGFDINCGINLMRTSLTEEDVRAKSKELVKELFAAVPCGVGGKGKVRLEDKDIDEVLVTGIDWAISHGYGTLQDKERTEEGGRMEGADPKLVSALAKKRGRAQLGTLGAGNHFLEIQAVREIYDKKKAKEWGIEKEGQIMIMIHSGSRGLGHQVATDYLKVQEEAVKKYKIRIADPQLACAPASSKEGKDFFTAMKCAVNYSFTNRHIMMHWTREVFEKVYGKKSQEMGIETLYGICHNVVKLEEYMVNGKKKKLFVHRKGATRSFPGEPVLIAGSMGTSSYLLQGTEHALALSFGSSAHGAGRAMSRNKALKEFDGDKIKHELSSCGIESKATHPSSFAEEAPKAYKDVDEVIASVAGARISLPVAKLVPVGVIKG